MSRSRFGRFPSLFATGLLVALVFLSGLDLHPAGQVHEMVGDGSPGALDIASGPAHPGHSRSICPGFPDSSEHPLCPACLQHLLTSGGHLAAVVTAVPPVRLGLLQAALAVRVASGGERPSGARAPPLA